MFDPELVVVCVKSHSLPQVSREIKEHGLLNGKFSRATFILLMNGMGNKEMLNLPPERVYEGVTSIGVKFSQDGMVELKGIAKTVFEDGIISDVKEFLKKRFGQNGYEIEFAPDFKKQQWNKLFVNSVINPITALTGKNNGIVLSCQLKDTVERIVEECVKVAGMEGVEAEKDDVLKFVSSVASKTALNTSSMLQDVQKGKATEIDSINGYVIRLARKHGVSVPANETLYALVKALEG
ncbi:MAG: 2-dehydropantoate 2-reductase [Methanosaeta sp. PtaB.Bin018]|jgi:2-dehydropantoate 2-reductase|nr:MAG: 2-dehydropantoate 2-reductase [Methanosaeta sp. PtaB.Bin018]OPY46508.1 MAG: 2-dehydropantoate 2-reductase [Methanosaeta sp. PtaU1.Bin016]